MKSVSFVKVNGRSYRGNQPSRLCFLDFCIPKCFCEYSIKLGQRGSWINVWPTQSQKVFNCRGKFDVGHLMIQVLRPHIYSHVKVGRLSLDDVGTLAALSQCLIMRPPCGPLFLMSNSTTKSLYLGVVSSN
jgi:hypothetical protein